MSSNEREPLDLWSAVPKPAAPAQSPKRRLLPHDLDVALKYLTDGELNALAKAVDQEKSRRTPLPTAKPRESQVPARRLLDAPGLEGLTQSQINLIRSSVKAGVKPTTLSRQFGLKKSQIAAVLKLKG